MSSALVNTSSLLKLKLFNQVRFVSGIFILLLTNWIFPALMHPALMTDINFPAYMTEFKAWKSMLVCEWNFPGLCRLVQGIEGIQFYETIKESLKIPGKYIHWGDKSCPVRFSTDILWRGRDYHVRYNKYLLAQNRDGKRGKHLQRLNHTVER